MFRYPSNQIIMCNVIGISMNKYEGSANMCIKND